MASSLLRRSLSLFRRYSSSSSSPIRRAIASQSLSLSFASSKPNVEETLNRVIGSLIERQETQIIHAEFAEMSKGFPFEIIDNPGEKNIILKREFEGEDIHITVLMDDEAEDEDETLNDKDNNGNGSDNLIQPTVALYVNIYKGVQYSVEFCCNLDLDKLEIERMEMKIYTEDGDEKAYHELKFKDLDESLQNALCNYLGARGITCSLFDFLTKYMINKGDREYLFWLKNLKLFIKK